jgi:hypothetical protein
LFGTYQQQDVLTRAARSQRMIHHRMKILDDVRRG